METTDYYPHLIGDPYVIVVSSLEADSDDESPCNNNNNNNNKNNNNNNSINDNIPLLIDIDATLWTLEDDEAEIPTPDQFARFTTSCRILPGELIGDAARDFIAATLYDAHVVDVELVPFVVDKILCCYADNMAALKGFPRRITAIRVKAIIDVFVDELPSPEEDPIPIDDDYVVRLLPASRESIEGLEKAIITDKVVTCTVCIEDIRVGSEATRLPCSHCYHRECIVEWLEKNKVCPLCRFQMP